MQHSLLAVLSAFLLTACAAATSPVEMAAASSPYLVSAEQEDRIRALMEEHDASAIGIGVIRDGQLVWTRYYGQQAAGVPVTRTSMFNTASVAKAVTTETVLRLVEQGVVDLDEPISDYYVHPDIADDPRHRMLTPRIILTHRTGFLNWPYAYEDGRLAFTFDPGEDYGDSGAGFEILANFLAAKLDRPFAQIVRETVFDPIGMERASVIQAPWMVPYQVMPIDEDGAIASETGRETGEWNAADDLYVTVEDYARFLISVMNGDGVGPALAAERVRVQSDLTDNEIWRCGEDVEDCPQPYGHGLGWFVFGYDGNLNVQHGGNDQSEAAIGYFETQTHSGMVVFTNAPAPQGVILWPKIVDILDDRQRFTPVFHSIIARFFGADAEQ